MTRQDRPAPAGASRSAAMSAGLARNWWAVGLRGMAALFFGVGVLVLPPATIASLVLAFAVYVAADGALAIVAGARAASRGERWWLLIVEGLTNLAAAGAVLVWPALIVIPFVRLAGVWAAVTGALILAAARRLSLPHGRRLLTFAGVASCAWGIAATAAAPSSAGDLPATGRWLAAYALLFGTALLVLTVRLKQRRAGEESI